MLRSARRLGWILLLASGAIGWALPARAQTPEGGPPERITIEELRREPPPTATDELAQRFLDTYRRVLGGDEALAALTTLQRTGTVREGRQERQITEAFAWPDRYRRDTRWRDAGRPHHEVVVVEGDAAWRWTVSPPPPPGRPPRELPAGERAMWQRELDLLGPLILGPERGWHFVYRGATQIRSRPGYLVLGAAPDGRRQWFYFDAETYLCTRVGFRDAFGTQQADADRYVTRMVRSGGLWWPAEVEYETGDRVYRQETWTRVEAGVTFAPEHFRPPPRREIILQPRPAQP